MKNEKFSQKNIDSFQKWAICGTTMLLLAATSLTEFAQAKNNLLRETKSLERNENVYHPDHHLINRPEYPFPQVSHEREREIPALSQEIPETNDACFNALLQKILRSSETYDHVSSLMLGISNPFEIQDQHLILEVNLNGSNDQRFSGLSGFREFEDRVEIFFLSDPTNPGSRNLGIIKNYEGIYLIQSLALHKAVDNSEEYKKIETTIKHLFGEERGQEIIKEMKGNRFYETQLNQEDLEKLTHLMRGL